MLKMPTCFPYCLEYQEAIERNETTDRMGADDDVQLIKDDIVNLVTSSAGEEEDEMGTDDAVVENLRVIHAKAFQALENFLLYVESQNTATPAGITSVGRSRLVEGD